MPEDKPKSSKLIIIPTSLDEANYFVSQQHRHLGKVTGHKFSIAVGDDSGLIHGVAIVGRPIARMDDDGVTLEVSRVCTDGTKNTCSMLYRSAWRAAVAMGYRRLITHTLEEEGGSSLRGSGFTLIGKCGGGSWSRNGRPRIDKHPLQQKWKWALYSP